MKKLFCGLLICAAVAPAAAEAQVSIDMTRITCADYLAMGPGESQVFSAWMSGWYNQKGGSVSVDLVTFEKNVGKMKDWCRSNPNQIVMGGIQAMIAR